MVIKNIYYRIYQGILVNIMRLIKYKNKVISGNGAVCHIPGILKKQKLCRVLVITGPHLAKTGMFRKTLAFFNKKGLDCTVFSGTNGETCIESIEEARKRYVLKGCNAIIALGGGSVIDCAKAAAAGIANPGKSIKSLSGYQKVRKKIPVIVAVPTTAGTGAEATACAVIKDASGNKKIIADIGIIPKYAVLDPAMTAGMPKNLIAYSAMDAFTHATESYLNKYSSRNAEKDAEKAIKLIVENITSVYYGNGSVLSRKKMLDASYLAGRAFLRTSVGYVHAIGHAIGGRYNLPHGMVVSAALPYVLEWYGACIHAKLARLADVSGITGEDDMPVYQKAEAYIRYIKMLNHRFSINENFYTTLENRLRSENPGKFPRDKYGTGGKILLEEKDVKNIAKCAIIESNPYYPVPRIMTLKECEMLIYRICTR